MSTDEGEPASATAAAPMPTPGALPIGHLLIAEAEKLGLSNLPMDRLLTLVVDIEPFRIEGGDDGEKSCLCHNTATTLWRLFAGMSLFEFNCKKQRIVPAESFCQCLKLAARIFTGSLAQENAIYRIAIANHEFIVVTRSGYVEILQSFMGMYTFGWWLLRHSPYDAYVIAEGISRLHGVDAPARLAQMAFFGRPLDFDSYPDVFNYSIALLKDDDIFLPGLRKHMQERVDAYGRFLRRTMKPAELDSSTKATDQSLADSQTTGLP